jgi:1-acyl-sn-glycerol-3-phosphate acyltransferase
MSAPKAIGRGLIDAGVSAVLWVYFALVGLFVVVPTLVFIRIFSRDVEAGFQKVNSRFLRIFFAILEALSPGITISVTDEVRSLRSSVIVCNHLSYLDAILLLSLFEKQKTIVKPIFFKAPLFGWVVDNAGYMPAALGRTVKKRMVDRVVNLGDYLDSGGNLFVFPEGHRSKDGTLGEFEPGAFKLAKRAGRPIDVLEIKNTDRVFPPGSGYVRATRPTTIELRRIGRIDPSAPGSTGSTDPTDPNAGPASPQEMAAQARNMYPQK